MLGQDIAAALPGLRAEAESLMQDACTITTGGGDDVWDDATGEWTPGTPSEIYAGKCRVRQPNAGASTESGESAFSVSDRIVSIPLTTLTVPVGATVTITATASDPSLVGAAFTYISPASQQTHPTARRLLCRKVD